MVIEGVKDALSGKKPTLGDRSNVESIGIFGSYVRSTQKKKRDPDVLAEFYRTICRFTFVGLEDFLSDVPEVKVDRVMKSTPKPRIKDLILKEAVYL